MIKVKVIKFVGCNVNIDFELWTMDSINHENC